MFVNYKLKIHNSNPSYRKAKLIEQGFTANCDSLSCQKLELMLPKETVS